MVSLKVVWVVLDDHKTNVSEHRPGDYPLSMSELDQENSASNYLRPNSYATGHCGDRARVVSHWFAKYAPVLLRQVDGIAIDRGEPLAERLATVGVMTGFSAPIGKITRVPLRDVWKHEGPRLHPLGSKRTDQASRSMRRQRGAGELRRPQRRRNIVDGQAHLRTPMLIVVALANIPRESSTRVSA